MVERTPKRSLKGRRAVASSFCETFKHPRNLIVAVKSLTFQQKVFTQEVPFRVDFQFPMALNPGDTRLIQLGLKSNRKFTWRTKPFGPTTHTSSPAGRTFDLEPGATATLLMLSSPAFFH